MRALDDVIKLASRARTSSGCSAVWGGLRVAFLARTSLPVNEQREPQTAASAVPLPEFGQLGNGRQGELMPSPRVKKGGRDQFAPRDRVGSCGVKREGTVKSHLSHLWPRSST